MKQLIVVILLLPFLYMGAIFVASEYGGEVVELETEGARDRKFPTSLWVIEMNGDLWLRAGNADAEWLARLQTVPDVFLTRNGVRTAYRAEIVDYATERVNEAMLEKYGWAEYVVSTIHDDDEVVAVRLLEP